MQGKKKRDTAIREQKEKDEKTARSAHASNVSAQQDSPTVLDEDRDEPTEDLLGTKDADVIF